MSDNFTERLKKELPKIIPERYTSFVQYNEAEKSGADDVVYAYDFLTYSVFLDYRDSVEYQTQSETLRWRMEEIGYYVAIIWFHNKTLDEVMEMLDILEFDFPLVLETTPHDIEGNMYIDFLKYENNIYKLYGLFNILELHNGGIMKYEKEENIENMNLNMMHLRKGIIRYILNYIQAKPVKNLIKIKK